MNIEERIPLLEEILGQWKAKLGNDYLAYRNHVYRMSHFCFVLHECTGDQREKVLTAACFHDLGIWVNDTLDYLPPSVALARDYLSKIKREAWIDEIALMIDMHHKLRKYSEGRSPLVEVFRKGDLVDFSLGMVKCGVSKADIKRVKDQFPNAGFHKRLVQLGVGWFLKHPLNPLPFLKW